MVARNAFLKKLVLSCWVLGLVYLSTMGFPAPGIGLSVVNTGMNESLHWIASCVPTELPPLVTPQPKSTTKSSSKPKPKTPSKPKPQSKTKQSLNFQAPMTVSSARERVICDNSHRQPLRAVWRGLLKFTNESFCLTDCASTKPPPAANGCPTVRLSRFKRVFNPCLHWLHH